MKTAHAGTIKNPLTIIAIFAGIAEISGTLVLPHIAPDNQHLYIWFLMSFPSLLVIIFFATLNFNHRVLYAPSDFSDEGHFVNLIRKASPIEVLGKVAADEVAAIDVKDEMEKGGKSISDTTEPNAQIAEHSNNRDIVALTESIEPVSAKELTAKQQTIERKNPTRSEEVAAEPSGTSLKGQRRRGFSARSLEKFSILETSREFFNAEPQFDVKLGESSYVFDAITNTGKSLTIWESFVVSNPSAVKEKARRFLQEAEIVCQQMTEKLQTTISVVVMPIYGSTVSQDTIDASNKELQLILSAIGLNGIVVGKRMDSLWRAANEHADMKEGSS